jgi:hypothetical protein
MTFLCRNGRCRNVPGSFNCECADGYILAADGQHCRDVDECHEVGAYMHNTSSMCSGLMNECC